MHVMATAEIVELMFSLMTTPQTKVANISIS